MARGHISCEFQLITSGVKTNLTQKIARALKRGNFVSQHCVEFSNCFYLSTLYNSQTKEIRKIKSFFNKHLILLNK